MSAGSIVGTPENSITVFKKLVSSIHLAYAAFPKKSGYCIEVDLVIKANIFNNVHRSNTN